MRTEHDQQKHQHLVSESTDHQPHQTFKGTRYKSFMYDIKVRKNRPTNDAEADDEGCGESHITKPANQEMLFRERPFQSREVQRRGQYCARRASNRRNYKEWKQTRMRVAGPANHEVLRAHQQGKKSPSCERVAISYGDIAN